MKIFITGGTGFIGYNLIKRLLLLGHQITTTGVKTENKLPSEVKILNLGLNGIEEKHLENQDICFHLSANNDTLDNDKEEMFKSNVHDPIKLFKKLFEKGCKKFIYASSTAVYGDAPSPYTEETKTNPLNVYAESKLEFDKFAMEFAVQNKINIIGLRYCNIYGPHEEHKNKRASMIYQMYKSMIQNKSPKLFEDGNQKRDWCYVKDVVEANIKCIDYENNDIFNIASGKSISFNNLLFTFNSLLNKKILPEYIQCEFSEKYQSNIECDISKAKEKLNWTPKYNVTKGIMDYSNYLSSL